MTLSLAGLAAAPKRRITWSPNDQVSASGVTLWGLDANGSAIWPNGPVPFTNPGSNAGAVPTSYTFMGKTYSGLPADSALVRTRFEGASFRHRVLLLDLMWTSGYLSMTASTPVTIGSPTLPARDLVGGTNGLGCYLLAFSGGGVNPTISATYTDSAGGTGMVASGSLALAGGGPSVLSLDTGSSGVKSVQSVVSTTNVTTLLLAIVKRVAYYSVPANYRAVGDGSVVLGGRETSDLHNLHVMPAGTLLFPVWGVMGSNTATLHGVTIDLAEV